jgi:nucleotidyltransferase substrate binding protein (TIGR01987 family)
VKLDYSSLNKAIASLEHAIVRAKQHPEDEELRDAVIQRFEYTMDLSWKFMQRIVKIAGVPETSIRTKRDIFREAAGMGLIPDPTAWFVYYEARNETSHTYNRIVAQRVYGKAEAFLGDVKALYRALPGAENA